jgi:glutamate-1-semialdehyde 2,1-aminomutase
MAQTSSNTQTFDPIRRIRVEGDNQSIDGPEGRSLWARADRVLPGGMVYRSRSADMAGRGILPGFIASADGCRVTDVDGRGYIDFMGANGPNLLGYRHPEVEAAARDQASQATSASMFPPAMVDIVEALVDRYDDMAWGMVAKTGSETLSLAARIARQDTQRAHLIAFTAAYHGSDAELALIPPAGQLSDLTANVHRIAWNDADGLRELAARQGNDVAAMLLNPLDQRSRAPTVEASEAFVAAITEVQQQYGIRLVFDDVRHGFRLHPQGSERLLGVHPDLICLGKALGNGYSISAIVGREDLRQAASRIMFTSTYVFEAPPMCAALATLTVYERDDVFAHISRVGQRLKEGILAAAEKAGHRISMTGPVTMPTLLFEDDPEFTRLLSFASHSAHLGAIFHPAVNWNLSLAHQDADIDEAISIAEEAFRSTEQ